MRRTGVTLALCCLLGCRSNDADRTPVYVDPGLGALALKHTTNLVGFGPRHTGSPGWRRGTDYIIRSIRRMGLEPRVDRWEDPNEGLSFVNVSTTIPGEFRDRIVIGCHHDTKCTTGHPDEKHNYHFVGANDSGSGVGLVLALAEHLRNAKPIATLEFVFFDGEESVPYVWDSGRALFGSKRFVKRYTQEQIVDANGPIRALILLDMVGARDLTIDRETRSTPALLDIVERAAHMSGHSRYFFEHSLDVTDDHIPFLNAGIPAVNLIDIADNPEWHTPHDTLDTLSATSLQVVGEVVMYALPVITRRFVLERQRRGPRVR